MPRVNVVKALIFDEPMEYCLLVKGPRLQAFGGPCTFEDCRKDLQIQVEGLIKMQAEQQPFWHLIRIEHFSFQDVAVHVYFGKLTREELTKAQRTASQPMELFPCGFKSVFGDTLSSRLRYLIPMAIELSKQEQKDWPKP